VLKPQTVRDSFDRLAGRYDRHAALEQEVCSRLLERTDFQKLEPLRIFDLGCGTGAGSSALKKKFRKAEVISLDASYAMLRQLQRKSRLLRPLRPVCGDISALPLASQSADMVFSNLATYWSPDPLTLFAEIRRVLRPDGLLLFTTFGPSTMNELRHAWDAVDATVQMPDFPDLMEVGDALAAAGFREPVMDMENVTLHYPEFDALAEEIEATGSAMLVRGWGNWRQLKDQLACAFQPLLVERKYPLSYEIIYGTAFGPPEGQPRKTAEGDVVTISLDSLLQSRPMGYD
jgi:malonyl-CoA O-methyltransferase